MKDDSADVVNRWATVVRRMRRGATGNHAIFGSLEELTHTTLAQLEEMNGCYSLRDGEYKKWSCAVLIQAR